MGQIRSRPPTTRAHRFGRRKTAFFCDLVHGQLSGSSKALRWNRRHSWRTPSVKPKRLFVAMRGNTVPTECQQMVM
jgi:hypothetical protein